MIISIATIIAIGQEVWVMIQHGKVELSDLLLLFIYLEVITMIGIYYEKNMLPVRFPIYITIVAGQIYHTGLKGIATMGHARNWRDFVGTYNCGISCAFGPC